MARKPTHCRPSWRGAGTPVPFPSLRGRGMERREAPGRCATAPLHAPCDRGVYAPCGQVCETHPEARASCDGGFARLAARTLRLPALHREPCGHVCPIDTPASTEAYRT